MTRGQGDKEMMGTQVGGLRANCSDSDQQMEWVECEGCGEKYLVPRPVPLVEQVRRIIEDRDNALELAREVLATLSLPQNSEVTVGGTGMLDYLRVWLNKWSEIVGPNVALGQGWVINWPGAPWRKSDEADQVQGCEYDVRG